MAWAWLALPLTAGTWLVDADALRRELAAPTAPIVVDARDKRAFTSGHVPGAIHLDWKDFRNGRFRTGRLPDDLIATQRRLAEAGIDTRRPVVAYGAAHEGWGEEGRTAWMLHVLGHPNVRVLDGGYAAWVRAGGTTTRETPRVAAGRWDAPLRPDARADIDRVAAGLADSSRTIVLDVRTRGEWNGQRKYWEPRTGHMPGARHLPWTTFLDSRGLARQDQAFRDSLGLAGVTADRKVLVYCTGGVRSAEVFWMLRALGFPDVRNYDGSWYEWAFDRARPVVRP